MADHLAPDYPLQEALDLDSPEQMSALFEDTRGKIIDLLGDRAATIKELAEALGKPKGTIGHHVHVLAEAGLIRVVRTERIRAIEAKYYGRTARTFVIGNAFKDNVELGPGHFLVTAASEYADAADRVEESLEGGPFSTLRYARIPDHRVKEWSQRLFELAEEFTGEERGGDTTYGLVIGLYPTDRPRLPSKEQK